VPLVLVTLITGLLCAQCRATPSGSAARLVAARPCPRVARGHTLGAGARTSTSRVGCLIWYRDLASAPLSGWGFVQSCPGPSPPAGVTAVSNPVHPGWRHSLRFTISDQSVHANCPILGSPGHPNAEVTTPGLFKPGDDDYIGFSTFFPAGFPQICTPWINGCFMQVAEVYGLPFGGSSPIGIDVIGSRLVMATYTSGTVWTASIAIRYGVGWEDLVLHVRFSTHAQVGFVELWLNGRRQRFTNGSTRFYEATLQPGVNWDGKHPDSVALDQYRGNVPALGTTVLYHTGVKVGTTYAAAAP
jgi:hypothetical protein